MDVCIYVRYMHAFTYMCMYFKIILMPGFACRLQFLFVCLNVNPSLYFIFWDHVSYCMMWAGPLDLILH